MSTREGSREHGDKVRKRHRSQRRQVIRGKRAVVACNQCRTKRIKCQSDEFGATCQNCIQSRSACEYSDSVFLQNWLDHENAPAHIYSGPEAEKVHLNQGSTIQGVDERFEISLPKKRASLREGDSPMENDSFFASQNNAITTEATVQDPEVNDGLERSLIYYLVPMITGCNFEIPVLPPLQRVDLPGMPLLKAMVDAYFAHVAPIYPILDEKSNLDRSKLLSPTTIEDNSISNLLLRIVVCTGAACMNDQDINGYDIKYIRESIFSQVLSEAQLIHSNFGIINVQIMILVTIYCWQTERLNKAWHWCGWAIRKAHYLEMGLGRENLLDNKERVDFLKWSLFILESQLSLLQYRDDSKLKSESIESPSVELKNRYPVFFFRVSLARLVHKFSLAKGPERQQTSTSFHCCLKSLSEGISALKDSVPMDWRPEHEIFADPTEHPSVFALHLEYHMLHMQIFTSRKARARMMTQHRSLRNTESDMEGAENDHVTSYIASARMIFQILGGIRASPRLNDSMKWLSPSIHLLGAFQVLYAFVTLRPLYISASSDVQLLGSACRYFESGMANLVQGPKILSVMQMMQAKALTEVQNAIGHSSSTPEAVSSDIMTTNNDMTIRTGNHGYESLLFGYSFSDLQSFHGVNDIEVGLEFGAVADAL